MMFPLVGNEKIALILKNAIKENRLPHAIIVEGDEGLGKHTLARFISFAAVCESEDAPCGVCKGCHLADLYNHPDITVISAEDGKKNIAVSQIRKLKEETVIKPHMAKKRVFIIDGANTMNENSQNALLKVLEEPPGDIVFILITESKSALLDTIISRCVTLTLNAPEISQSAEFVAEKSGKTIEIARETLMECVGNIGKALDILAGKGDNKTLAAAKTFIEAALQHDEWGMITALAPFEKKRVEADLFLKDLKNETALNIKKYLGKPQAKKLNLFYKRFPDFERSLLTNINLSLMFSQMSAEAFEIFK